MSAVSFAEQSCVASATEGSMRASLPPIVDAVACETNHVSGILDESKRDLREGPIGSTAISLGYEVTAVKILDIITSYGVHSERGSGSWDAFDEFLPMVTKHVTAGTPVKILLPGFPFKENSKGLVLGSLPDLGEELALAHLQGLCDNISTVYENGAEILVCSDGLVYCDLMGVSEEAAWDYGEALRTLAAQKQLRNIKFIRLWNLLDHPSSRFDHEPREQAKAHYCEYGSRIRRELLNSYGDVGFDARRAVEADRDWKKTHAAYTDVLARKEAESPENIAMQMIERGKAYGAALNAKLPDYVRFSIHDSTGKGKLSLALIPGAQRTDSIGYMPWRSAIAVDADGSYRTVYPDQARDTHELVYRNGLPYCFRVKSDLFDWSNSGLEVDFEHLYPCGIIIRPIGGSPSMRMIPMHKVRHLSNNFSPVVLRGFNEASDNSNMTNDVTFGEAMHTNFDGLSKLEDHENPVTGEIKKVVDAPRYQYLSYLLMAPEGDGTTLFSNSRLFFRYLPAPWTLKRLESVACKVTHNGVRPNVQGGLPLVVRHPVTDAPCLLWHLPWGGNKTKHSTYNIELENEEQSLQKLVENLAHDFRTCIRFSWKMGDFLVNDNTSVLHNYK